MGELFVGVDVGTGSARAGVVSGHGDLLGRAEFPIDMRQGGARQAEHDSGQIWRAVAIAVRGALRAAGAKAGDIAGVGFDATCSLVVRGAGDAPLPVAAGAAPRWDTMVWLDHRARAEAELCTRGGNAVLGHLGGVMSPEMQIPKLMWLKRHLPESWARMAYAFDLADFLTFRATGSLARSQSTLACKWTWSAETGGWPADFLAEIGLDDLRARAALPESATPAGSDLGPLTATAAAALGLTEQTRVAAGLIDAHAGALGVLGADAANADGIDRAVCLIAGTSNSVLALAPDPRPLPGVWGPYYGAILPGLWLLEAGQSATGALLDHLLRWHRAGGEPTAALHRAVTERIAGLRARDGDAFAADLHVLPDFHGNRSPLAEPAARGVISGLDLDSDFDSLCRLYWRAALSIAFGTRQNLDALAGRGFGTGRILIGGGHTRNPLLLDLYADVTGATIVEPKASDVMLAGSAMAAAVAAGAYPNLVAAVAGMSSGNTEHRPAAGQKGRYDRDYRIFLEMQRHRGALAGIG